MGGEGGGGHVGVASPRHLHVDDLGAGFLARLHHVAGLDDRDGAVVVPVDHVLGNVADLGHSGRVTAAGDRSERGKEIGLIHRNAPRAVRSHRVTHKVNSRGVDPVSALDLRHHVEDVLFRRAPVHGSRVAALRARHDKPDALGFALEQAIAV